jgi:signal peptidase I
MAPGFRAGDLLITKESAASSLKVGEVVILRAGADYQLYSHRIVSLKRSTDAIAITTKGDANPTIDAGLAQVNPLASVPHEIAHLPYLGRPIVYFSRHMIAVIGGFLLFLAAFLLILRLIAKKSSTEPPTTVLNEVPTPVIPQSLEVSAFEEERKKSKVKKVKNEKEKKKSKKSKNKSKNKSKDKSKKSRN